jgi:teichuronic acid biosynthesis glycosyltransferase TuaH
MTAAADWSDLVVLCASAPWGGAASPDHHLARGLTRFAPVLYVDPPGSPAGDGARPPAALTGRRSTHAGVEVLGPRLARVTPRSLPGQDRVGSRNLDGRVLRRTLERALVELGRPSVRAAVASTLLPCFGSCGEDLRVFYAADRFIVGDGAPGRRPWRRRRPLPPVDADLVVAGSPALAEAFRSFGDDPLLLPAGCDADALAAVDDTEPAPDVWLPQPIAGYLGHLSSRVDLRHLEAVASRGHSLLLVGAVAPGPTSGSLRSLLERPNVAWVGPRPPEAVPSYLRLIDVGLLPYADTPFNHVSFPGQLLDHLAAGRPVVATPVDAVRWLEERHVARRGRKAGSRPSAVPTLTSDDLAVVVDPERFADRVEKLFVAGRDQAAVDRRRAVARDHSWARRVTELAQALDLCPGGRSKTEGVAP